MARFTILLLLALCWAVASQAQTSSSPSSTLSRAEGETQPLWELGVFGASFLTPDYPSSNEDHTNTIIAPYFVYRGEVFRIGDGAGARAVAIEEDWVELDLSLDGAFDADSDDNPLRQGMPDLDFLFELGPQVIFTLATSGDSSASPYKLTLGLPLRAVFSTDFSGIEQRGYVFHPALSYQQTHWLVQDMTLFMSVAPMWASEKLQDYFYQVDPEFETEDRARFDAGAGYLGTDLTLGLSFDVRQNIRAFIGAQIFSHHGAENTQSPLFAEKNTFSFGAGFSWRLYQSKQTVNR